MRITPKDNEAQVELRTRELAAKIAEDASSKAQGVPVDKTLKSTLFKSAESLDKVQTN